MVALKNSETKIDKNGIILFLAITFGLTILASAISWHSGYGSGAPSSALTITVAVSMFFPGVSALIVRHVRGDGLEGAGLKVGPKKMYISAYVPILAAFAVAYGLTAAFISRPDLTLSTFTKMYGIQSPENPWLVILAISAVTLTAAPLLNSIPASGEEFGWRGYLLPRLMPLGEKKALAMTGLIWGLWHTPFILFLGFHYPERRLEGILIFTLIATFLGIYISYLRLASGSVLLASFAHGLFNSQFYGVWTVVFPGADPLMGGMSGLTGALALFGLALWVWISKLGKDVGDLSQAPG